MDRTPPEHVDLERLIAAAKADALNEAADDYDEAVTSGILAEFAEEHYRPGLNLPSLFLRHRAAAIAEGL